MLDKAGQRVTSHLKAIMSDRGDVKTMPMPMPMSMPLPQPPLPQQRLPQQRDQPPPSLVHHKAMHKENLITDTSTGTTYIKGKLLGKGGFANCYELIDTKSNVMYAGKIIPKERIAKPHQRAKIAREIELHKNLRHKNIVQFHGFFEDEDNVYIVLEYCGRKSLVHVLKCRKVLTEPEVRYYMRQLVDGCKYIHKQNIIHRDLKLGNMLLSENMQMKVADFGLATRVNYVGDKKMTVCGTPNYIAPEVLQKRGHSFEADTWALGCVMYAMLVGCPPFETPTLKETYLRIATNRFFIPSSVSEPARILMKRIMAPTPEARPSLDEILEDDFFYSGYAPTSLPVSCCSAAPKFPVTPSAPGRRTSRNSGINKVVKETTFADDVTEMHVVKDAHYQLKAPPPETKMLIRPPAFPSPPQTELVNGREAHDSGVHSRQGSPTEHDVGLELACAATSDVQVATSSAYPSTTYPSSAPPLPPPRHAINMNNAQSTIPSHGLASKLCQRLSHCLDRVEPCMGNPAVMSHIMVSWIVKWVDYSNKYGFGFQLSSRAVGVLFNDTTRIALSADGRMAEYTDLSQQTTTFPVENPPPKLQKRSTLLTYFATYMDENLIQGGDVDVGALNRMDMPSPVYMKKWFRTSKAIVMYLSNGTLQVNFFEDHTKVILSIEHSRYCLSFIDENRKASTYLLDDIMTMGCTDCVYERMEYARDMLQNILDIEGEDV